MTKITEETLRAQAIYCDYGHKELSEAKGELAHGCLVCHGEPWVDRIDNLEKQNELLKSLILLTHESVSDREMNELTATQWTEFIKEFPFKEQPDSGLCPTSYQTLSYRGDLELFEKFKEIETLLNKSAAGALESEALNGEEE